MELPKEKRTAQSEEGLSPWSSDSKEFGNGSPPEWRRGDSGSGGDCWVKRRSRRDHDGWWDTSAEPESELIDDCYKNFLSYSSTILPF